MSAILVFVSTFVSVFALGFQSRNVNQGHYLAASVTSLFISGGHLMLYKYLPQPNALEVFGYMAGGVLGINAAMWVHARTLSRRPAAVGGKIAPPKPWPKPPVDEHSAQHFPPCLDCGAAQGQSCARLVCERFSAPTRH